MTQAEMAALTHHGGRIDAAKALFPEVAGPWLDLSTGINPVAWCPSEGLDVDAGPLPDRSTLARLETLAAVHFGVEAERVAAVPGSEMALRLLPCSVWASRSSRCSLATARMARWRRRGSIIPRSTLGKGREGACCSPIPTTPMAAIMPARRWSDWPRCKRRRAVG